MEFKFLSRLETSPIVGKTNWAEVVRDFQCWSTRLAEATGDGRIVIKKGFQFDWDSVPRILPVTYAWLKNRAEKSACVHDWLYRFQPCSRSVADAVMLDAMVTEQVSWRHRWPIYCGVRVGGWVAWRRHRDEQIDPADPGRRGGK